MISLSSTDQRNSPRSDLSTERAQADVRDRLIELLRAEDIAEARRRPTPDEIRAAQTARADARSLYIDAQRSLGIDTARVDAVLRARNAQVAAAAKAREAEAEAASARLAESAAVDLEGWRAVAGDAMPFVPQSVIIGTPLVIWASPHSNILWDSQLQYGNNWARAKVSSSADESTITDTIRWIFMWTNPIDAYAVVNAASILYLNGFLKADASGSLFGGGNARLSAVVTLAQWKYWTEQPAPQDLSWENVGSVHADAGWFDDTDSRSVSGYGRANAQWLIIPPLATELFEVRLKLLHSQSDGSVVADFAESGRKAVCPYMVVQVLSNP